jgi:hypothetical protein
MDEESYEEPPPPSADKVARRAIVLSVICCRGITEGSATDEAAADLAKRSQEWLESLELRPELSAWEKAIIATPFGNLSSRDRVNAGWLSEALSVIAWALGKTDIPSYDVQCDPAETSNNLGFLQTREQTVLTRPSLRSIEQLRDYNEFLYNLHWRIRNFSINRNRYDFESLAKKAWGEPLLRYGLKFADQDIEVAGKPLHQAADNEWRSLASITQERHRASNWLIGYASEDFYEVTTDT